MLSMGSSLADVGDGARTSGGGCVEEFGKVRKEGLQATRSHADDDYGETEFVESVLMLNASVDGEEDVEVLFGKREKLSVFHTAPSRLGDCFHDVAWKGGTGASGDALV